MQLKSLDQGLSIVFLIVVAVMVTFPVNFASATSSLTINAVDQNGSVLHMWTTITQNGKTVSSGNTPLSCPITVGQTYTVTVSSTSNVVFLHWSNLNTHNPRTVTLHGSMTLVADYQASTTPPNPPPTTSSLTVNAVDQYGTVHHMWTAIGQNGQTVSAGYTPLTFTGTAGQTYNVAVSNYNNEIFVHWSNGNTNNPLTVTLQSTSQSLTADYQVGTTNPPPPPPPPTAGSISAGLSSTSVTVGQSDTVSGKVFDTKSAPMPNVNLVITAGTTFSTSTTSSSTGTYSASIPTTVTGTFAVNVKQNGGSVAASPLTLTVNPVPNPPPNPSGPIVGLGVFTPSLIPQFDTEIQKHGLKAPDYGDNFQSNTLNQYLPQVGKTLLFYSVTIDMNSVIATAKQSSYAVGYDLEPSNGDLSTPSVEYTGMINGISASAYYANQAAITAHQAGLKFCIVPSKNIYAGTNAWPSMLNGLNWNNIDCWYMQGPSEAGTASTVIARVLQYGAPVKAAHPNVIITTSINEGITGSNMAPSEVAQVWNGIKGHIDGIELHRYTSASDVDAILTAVGK